MIEPRNAVLELSRETPNGGRLASANAAVVATSSGRNRSGMLRHHR
jgi:hypothetical protein